MLPVFEKDPEKIHLILDTVFNGNYSYQLSENRTIHIKDSITLKNYDQDYLPVQFSTVADQFWILDSNLKSLDGSPIDCGEFLIHGNSNLISLEHGPHTTNSVHLENLLNLVNISHLPNYIKYDVTILNCPKINFETIKNKNITFKFNLNELTPLQIKQIVLNDIIIDFNNDYSQKTELVTALQKFNSNHNLLEFINFAQQNTFLKDVFNDEYTIQNTDLSL